MPRTTKQLKPHQWKKGQSGNPAGFKPLTEAEKALRRLTLHSYQNVIELALTGKRKELRALIKDPNTPAIQAGIATAILNAINRGDPSVLERFAARIVGEIPKNLNINGILNVDHQVTVVPPEVARKALRDIEEEI